uniref:Ig-like domain-containing protein n=1 Tax=Octopus bimaculoides TaxID=37653 RepID=A0A0L8GU28_OCTBM
MFARSSPPPSHHKSSSLIDCMDSPCAKVESVTTKTEFINDIGKIRQELISENERSNNISIQKQHKLTVESPQMLYLHQPRRGVRRYRQVREDKRVAKNNTFKSISNETKKMYFETNLSKSRRPTTNTRNITRQKIQSVIAESAATTLVASATVTVLTFDNTSEIGLDQFYDDMAPTDIYFVKKPPNTDASEIGNTLTYDCEVDTSNLTVNPEIYWTIPGMSSREEKVSEDLYAGDFRKDIFVTSNHSLVIKNVRREHKGIYKCVVTVGQYTQIVSVALSVNKKTKFELLIRLVVGFSAALVVIVVFGSLWIVLRILKNRKSRYIQCNLHESL